MFILPGYLTNAFLTGSIVAILAAMVGFFAVLRGYVFAAHALPKIGFAGAAGAILLNGDPIMGLAAFTTAGALSIGWLGKRGRGDAAVALTLVVALGSGALFLVLNNSYATGAYALLFGQMAGISRVQVWEMAALGAVSSMGLLAMYRPLLFTFINKEGAMAKGIPVEKLETAFLVVLGLATAVTVPVVGTLLSFSLLIGPAATAGLLTHHPLKAVGFAVVISLLTVWGSIVAAYATGWPMGFFVATLAASIYGAVRLGRGRGR